MPLAAAIEGDIVPQADSGWHRRNNSTPAAIARRDKYNSGAHKAAKERFRRDIQAGRGICWRCHQPIPPTAICGPDWQTGHDDIHTNVIRGPEHTTCNSRGGSIKGNRIANARRHVTRQTRAQTRAW